LINNPLKFYETLLSHNCENSHIILLKEKDCHYRCTSCNTDFILPQKVINRFYEELNPEKFHHKLVYDFLKDYSGRAYLLKKVKRKHIINNLK